MRPTRETGIVHPSPRLNPVTLILVAILAVPFALAGGTVNVVLAAVVWIVAGALLVRWWRTRDDPRPPTHVV